MQSQTVNLNRNQTLKIERPANASTGYKWDILLSPGLKLISETNELINTNPGSGSTRTWIIKLDSDDDQTCILWYHRPWESVNPNDMAIINVNASTQSLNKLTVFVNNNKLVGYNYKDIKTNTVGKAYTFELPNMSGNLDFYIYRNELVYLLSPEGFDILNCVYNQRAVNLGCPSGGLTGRGDGKIPSFFNQALKIGSIKL